MTLLKKHQEIEDELFDKSDVMERINSVECIAHIHGASEYKGQTIKSHIHSREERLLERVREELIYKIKSPRNCIVKDCVRCEEQQRAINILTLITEEV